MLLSARAFPRGRAPLCAPLLVLPGTSALQVLRLFEARHGVPLRDLRLLGPRGVPLSHYTAIGALIASSAPAPLAAPLPAPLRVQRGGSPKASAHRGHVAAGYRSSEGGGLTTLRLTVTHRPPPRPRDPVGMERWPVGAA